MFKLDLEKLKTLVEKEKATSVRSKSPIYSDIVRSEVSKLVDKISIKKLSDAIGVSKNFVYAIKQSCEKSKILGNAGNQGKQAFQFIQMPNALMKEKNDDLKMFMKVTTLDGISIEIFK